MTPPLLRAQINGILLSTLLFECANARVDFEGLILGTVVSKTRSVVDDASDTRTNTDYITIVIQGVHKLEPHLPKFYDFSGHVIESVLESYNIPPNLSVLGYLKYRRTEVHQLSLRDKAVALNLKIYLERKQAMTSPNPFDIHQSAIRDDMPTSASPLPVSMALFTAKTNENMSTHDYDYTLWSVGDDESSFEAVSVNISNMIESPHEDYQSFQSNLAVEAARYDASNRMMPTIRSVPTTLLIDGHEAMYKDSFEATKALAQSVLSSEQKVKEALEEIERLTMQVQLAQLQIRTRKTLDRQGGDKAVYHSPTLSSQASFNTGSPTNRPTLERFGSSTSTTTMWPDLL
ncbi:hypothetical protein MVEG_09189 [Podila verticillata NRRL 6337]|nr:hypothetical protein MVEG_09189 [Podila verticillata NRRL 6337]